MNLDVLHPFLAHFLLHQKFTRHSYGRHYHFQINSRTCPADQAKKKNVFPNKKMTASECVHVCAIDQYSMALYTYARVQFDTCARQPDSHPAGPFNFGGAVFLLSMASHTTVGCRRESPCLNVKWVPAMAAIKGVEWAATSSYSTPLTDVLKPYELVRQTFLKVPCTSLQKPIFPTFRKIE